MIYEIRRIRKGIRRKKSSEEIQLYLVDREQSIGSAIIVPNSALSATKYPIHRFILMLDDVQISTSFRYIFDSRITRNIIELAINYTDELM